MWPDTIKQLFRHHGKSQLNHLPKYIQDLKLDFIRAKHGWEASRREKAANGRLARCKWLWHTFCCWANTDPERANKACFRRDSQLASLPGTSPSGYLPIFCVWTALGIHPSDSIPNYSGWYTLKEMVKWFPSPYPAPPKKTTTLSPKWDNGYQNGKCD